MEFLQHRSDKYIDEMIYFIWDEFNIMISVPTMQKTIVKMEWTRKLVSYIYVSKNRLILMFRYKSEH